MKLSRGKVWRPALPAALVLAMAPVTMFAQAMEMPFGTPKDAAYAAAIWKTLQKERLIGHNAVNSVPQYGNAPHGMVIETLFSKMRIKRHVGEVIVKRNYGGPGVTPSKVSANRNEFLKAITVMFKREAGYDSDNADWFWAKFMPDGTLDKNEKGMPLAGRVAKGMDMGCIACHTNAGPERVFLTTAAAIDKKK